MVLKAANIFHLLQNYDSGAPKWSQKRRRNRPKPSQEVTKAILWSKRSDFGASWGHLGSPWAPLGVTWGRLGRSFGSLGVALGALLVHLGSHWALFWFTWGCFEPHFSIVMVVGWPWELNQSIFETFWEPFCIKKH